MRDIDPSGNPDDRLAADRLILLTGATGYVGRQFLARLEAQGRRVRCLARRPEALAGCAGPSTQLVHGDVLDPRSLRAAMEGVDVACYLVHAMAGGSHFVEQDRQAARNFAEAARTRRLGRIIYLGGLGRGPGLSAHLASRQEVGRILRESGVPTIEFRASIIIGAGSLSFEMIRALVDRLPIMVTPRWVTTPAQPIAIEDVIAYLYAALDLPLTESRVFEIGGPDRASYLDLMREYARQEGLKRWMIRVPVLTPRLSGLWLKLVTPLHARVGRLLIEGIRNPTVVENEDALSAFDIRPRPLAEAIAEARRRTTGV